MAASWDTDSDISGVVMVAKFGIIITFSESQIVSWCLGKK